MQAVVRTKFLNILLIITSLFGYLEWGRDNSSFLFQMEYLIFIQLFENIKSVIHPFILLPILGQILLLVTIFQKMPNKMLTYIGMGFLGLLLGLMFLIGILGLNFKIILSTLPFILTSIMVILNYKKWSNDNSQLAA